MRRRWSWRNRRRGERREAWLRTGGLRRRTTRARARRLRRIGREGSNRRNRLLKLLQRRTRGLHDEVHDKLPLRKTRGITSTATTARTVSCHLLLPNVVNVRNLPFHLPHHQPIPSSSLLPFLPSLPPPPPLPPPPSQLVNNLPLSDPVNLTPHDNTQLLLESSQHEKKIYRRLMKEIWERSSCQR